jgi:hypothetical protein
MSDRHVVFAVLDTVGMPKVAVSRPLDWNAAQNRWNALDGARRDAVRGLASYPTAGQPCDHYPDVPVRYFAVRSAHDPNWPAGDADHRRMRALVRGALGRWV